MLKVNLRKPLVFINIIVLAYISWTSNGMHKARQVGHITPLNFVVEKKSLVTM
jgi:hypothetical protein